MDCIGDGLMGALNVYLYLLLRDPSCCWIILRLPPDDMVFVDEES